MRRSHLLLGLAFLGVMSLAVAGCHDRDGMRGQSPTLRGTAAAEGGEGYVARAYPTGRRDSSVLLVESRVPARAQVGAPVEMETRVTNLLDIALNDVTVTYDLRDNFSVSQGSTLDGAAGRTQADVPPDAQRVGATAQPARMQGTAAQQAQPGQQGQYTWNVGQLGPRETRTHRVSGMVLREGTAIVCTDATYELCPGCLAIQAVAPSLNLSINVPSELLICEPINIPIQVSNTGSGMARNVRLTGQLPDGLTAEGGANTFNLDIGNLQGGQSRQANLRLNAARRGNFTINAQAVGEGNLRAEDSGTIAIREPVLVLAIEGPDLHYVNSVGDYQILVTNEGDGPARDTTVTFNLPQGASFSSATEGGRAAGGSAVWNLGTIQPGQTRRLNASANYSQQGTARAQATATAVCAQATSNVVTTEVQGIPAILLEMVDERDPVAIGQNEVYTIRVTNQGSQVDRNVQIVALIPDVATYVSANGPTQHRSSGQQVIFAPLASLAPQQAVTYTVTVRAHQAADARMRVQLTSDMLTAPVQEEEATNFFNPQRPESMEGTGTRRLSRPGGTEQQSQGMQQDRGMQQSPGTQQPAQQPAGQP